MKDLRFVYKSQHFEVPAMEDGSIVSLELDNCIHVVDTNGKVHYLHTNTLTPLIKTEIPKYEVLINNPNCSSLKKGEIVKGAISAEFPLIGEKTYIDVRREDMGGLFFTIESDHLKLIPTKEKIE